MKKLVTYLCVRGFVSQRRFKEHFEGRGASSELKPLVGIGQNVPVEIVEHFQRGRQELALFPRHPRDPLEQTFIGLRV